MDWQNIVLLIGVAGIIIFWLPKTFKNAKNAPKGTTEDWKGALLPILAVVGFVVFLVMMVRS